MKKHIYIIILLTVSVLCLLISSCDIKKNDTENISDSSDTQSDEQLMEAHISELQTQIGFVRSPSKYSYTEALIKNVSEDISSIYGIDFTVRFSKKSGNALYCDDGSVILLDLRVTGETQRTQPWGLIRVYTDGERERICPVESCRENHEARCHHMQLFYEDFCISGDHLYITVDDFDVLEWIKTSESVISNKYILRYNITSGEFTKIIELTQVPNDMMVIDNYLYFSVNLANDQTTVFRIDLTSYTAVTVSLEINAHIAEVSENNLIFSGTDGIFSLGFNLDNMEKLESGSVHSVQNYKNRLYILKGEVGNSCDLYVSDDTGLINIMSDIVCFQIYDGMIYYQKYEPFEAYRYFSSLQNRALSDEQIRVIYGGDKIYRVSLDGGDEEIVFTCPDGYFLESYIKIHKGYLYFNLLEAGNGQNIKEYSTSVRIHPEPLSQNTEDYEVIFRESHTLPGGITYDD